MVIFIGDGELSEAWWWTGGGGDRKTRERVDGTVEVGGSSGGFQDQR